VVVSAEEQEEVLEHFKTLHQQMKAEQRKILKVFLSDNGGEYKNGVMEAYCKAEGIQHVFARPYTPQQNGVSERVNRTLMEKAAAIRLAAGLPRECWSVCILAACYLLNRTVDARGITPYQAWYKQKPVIAHPRAIVATPYAHQDESQRGKMDAKAAKGILVGYGEDHLPSTRFWSQRGS